MMALRLRLWAARYEDKSGNDDYLLIQLEDVVANATLRIYSSTATDLATDGFEWWVQASGPMRHMQSGGSFVYQGGPGGTTGWYTHVNIRPEKCQACDC